jgi:CubicO group peptidase (beta-lactamase class C family)
MRGLTSTFLGRFILWNTPMNRDHLRFPARTLSPAERPFEFPKVGAPPIFGSIHISKDSVETTTELQALLERTGTTTFVVIKDQQLLYEAYPNGGSRGSVNRCFSVTKSLLSALIGIAIAEGKFGGIGDSVKACLPEFAGSALGDLSIAHLLQMPFGNTFFGGAISLV